MPEFKIPLFELNFDEAEAQAVAETVRSRWISMGPKTAALEERFAAHVGTPHAVCVNSCTAALHLALALLVEPGDEVIVPSLTFVATVNAVRYVGAKPVFADVKGVDDLTIDMEDVRRKITPRTRAVVVMHYGGFACDMAALDDIVREHGLRVVEDAAHAPTSQINGRNLGTFGDIGCFSFYSNKNITCAEGGMLVTADDEWARRARLMRSHGMTSISYDRVKGHATSYDVVELGYNYRIDDIRASLGLTQLEKLEPDAASRNILRARYEQNLRDVGELTVPFRNNAHASSNYIFPVVLRHGGPDRREHVRKRLADEGIQTSVHYPPAHRFSIYRDAAVSLPETEFIADHEITLPLFTRMSLEQVDRVTQVLTRAVHEEVPA